MRDAESSTNQVLLYQIWLFIEPGLYKTEKNWASKITIFTSLCFLTGVAFAYFVMIPSMLKFAASFGSEQIANNIDINEYLSFITMILLAAGLLLGWRLFVSALIMTPT